MEVERIWGKEIWVVNDNEHKYCHKKLVINKGSFSSLHSHNEKLESLHIEKGRVLIEYDGRKMDLTEGETITILPEKIHRFAGYTDAIISEVSTFHDDSDVNRIEEGHLGKYLFGVDVDGTLNGAGGIINKEHLTGKDFVIISSRSCSRSKGICDGLGIIPITIINCRVLSRAEEMAVVDRMFPLRRTIYVGDMESDKIEAFRAGWKFMFPFEFIKFCMEESNGKGKEKG